MGTANVHRPAVILRPSAEDIGVIPRFSAPVRQRRQPPGRLALHHPRSYGNFQSFRVIRLAQKQTLQRQLGHFPERTQGREYATGVGTAACPTSMRGS